MWGERFGLILRMRYVYSAMKLNTSSYKFSLIATWDAVLAVRSRLSDELLYFTSINLEKLDKLSTAGIDTGVHPAPSRILTGNVHSV